MDAIVEQALAKWPNVPHCYGWLALDARGHWRMRDEQAQQQGLPGDRIHATALRGFIERNYTHDEHGQWYFQNGPQRVYIDLEMTPFVARTDPALGFMLQTQRAMTSVHTVWLTDGGRLLLEGECIALLDDRDMAACLALLHDAHGIAAEEALLRWLAANGQGPSLTFQQGSRQLPVRFIDENSLESRFDFVRHPRPA